MKRRTLAVLAIAVAVVAYALLGSRTERVWHGDWEPNPGVREP